MRCGRVRLTLFFPLHNSNFLYQIENVVCYPFRTANLVDNGTKEGQIGEGCLESSQCIYFNKIGMSSTVKPHSGPFDCCVFLVTGYVPSHHLATKLGSKKAADP